ncbi:hypothetical protein PFISCL1PPCAC_18600, partial [Pristionchus fissidentatus]
SGLCAYAEGNIHPIREFIMYKSLIESLARPKGNYTRYNAMFDEVPEVIPIRHGRGVHTTTGGDDEKRSVDSSVRIARRRRPRVTRVPSTSNVASMGAGGAPRRYGGYG